jgi:hypothetical protein
VSFLQDKSETQEVIKKFLRRTQNEFDAKVKKIVSHVFEFLEVSAIFYKRGQSLLNLLLRLMKVSYLVMIQTLAHTVFSM